MRQTSVPLALLLLVTLVPAQQMSLTTTFASNNGQSGNMFDIRALNNVTIDSFDVNLDAGTWDLEVYTVGGSWVSNNTNAAAWTLIGSTTGVVSAGANLPTPLPIPINQCMNGGTTRAFYVTVTNGTAMNYTNGSAVGSIFASDANIEFLEGGGIAYAFGVAFMPRVWNGNIYYTPSAACVSADPFQLNQPNSSLDLAGSATNGFQPAATTVCGGGVVPMNATSAAPTQFDIAVTLSPLVPGPNLPALVTPGGQIVNVDITHPSFFFFNTLTANPSLNPFVPFSLPLSSAAPIQAAAQLLVIDPGNTDGFALSQGVELIVVAATPTPMAGPTGNDQSIQLVLGSPPFCGPVTVPFCGTTYTDIFVNSNGSISFGGGDSSNVPTPAAAASGPPRVGFWADLDPAAGGSIMVVPTSNDVRVDFLNVPYFLEPTSSSTFSITIDSAGNITLDLSGVGPNPISGGSGFPADAQWLGLSCGNGATDPGITAFSAGGTGSNLGSPTDMIYDYLSGPGVQSVSGLLPSAVALQSGSGMLNFLPGAAPGEYAWSGI